MHQQTGTSLPLAPTRTQGADITASGVRYRTWADKRCVELAIYATDGKIIRTLDLHAEGEGYFSVVDEAGRPGDLYRYRFGGETFFPDPASRWQPLGVHGPSMVIDPGHFAWTDQDFCRPELADLVIYELHVGTFTEEGTFTAATAKLEHIAALGATAIEIMPVAEFPGSRNWGYDGVAIYAPSRAYGHPDDLRAFVDAAHSHGLVVILDVVYNHLGPDGNYIGAYHQHYFNSRHKTPWGDALNFERLAVRRFFVENAPYWRNEFHFDGFRLDATHAIIDPSESHILAEITDAIHACGGFAIAEDDRKLAKILKPTDAGGLGFDGCWADDFHHIVHVMLTDEQEGYYSKYAGKADELARAINGGWLSDPEYSKARCGLESSQFIFTISNHDQVGNRAFGERLGHLTDAAAYRAASALLCLTPQMPFLFMGQEWNSSSPFQYFTDHNAKLGKAVTEGRRYEFRHFAAFADPGTRDVIPDPQAEHTFMVSKLRWEELQELEHARIFDLYVACLKVRRAHIQTNDDGRYEARVVGDGAVAILFGGEECRLVVIADLRGCLLETLPLLSELIGSPASAKWNRLLSTNEPRFWGSEERNGAIPRTEVFVRAA